MTNQLKQDLTDIVDKWLRKESVWDVIVTIAYDGGSYHHSRVVQGLKDYVSNWLELGYPTFLKGESIYPELLLRVIQGSGAIDWDYLAAEYMGEAYIQYDFDEDLAIEAGERSSER